MIDLKDKLLGVLDGSTPDEGANQPEANKDENIKDFRAMEEDRQGSPESPPSQNVNETQGEGNESSTQSESQESNKGEGGEPSTLLEDEIVVDGKKGKAFITPDKRVIVEFEDGSKKEYEFKQFLQKGIASDDRFREASLLRQQVEEQKKQLELQKQTLSEAILNVAQKVDSGEELVQIAKQLGIPLPEDFEEFPEDNTDEIYRHIITELKRRQDVVNQKLEQAHQQLIQFKMNQYLASEPIQALNKYAPKTEDGKQLPLGNLLFVGLTKGVIEAAEQNGMKIGDAELEEIWDKTEKALKQALNGISTDYVLENIGKLGDKEKVLFQSMISKHPEWVEEIKRQAVEEYKQKIGRAEEHTLPTSGGAGETPPERIEIKPGQKPVNVLKSLLGLRQ